MPSMAEDLLTVSAYSTEIRRLPAGTLLPPEPSMAVIEAAKSILLQAYGRGTASFAPTVHRESNRVRITMPIRMIGDSGPVSSITLRLNRLRSHFNYAIEFERLGQVHYERSSSLPHITTEIASSRLELCISRLFPDHPRHAVTSVDTDPVSIADRRGE